MRAAAAKEYEYISRPISLKPAPRFFHFLIALLFAFQGLLGIIFSTWLIVVAQLEVVSLLFFGYSLPSLLFGALASRIAFNFKSRVCNWAFFVFATLMGMLVSVAIAGSALVYSEGDTLLLWICIIASVEIVLVIADLVLVGLTRNWNWVVKSVPKPERPPIVFD